MRSTMQVVLALTAFLAAIPPVGGSPATRMPGEGSTPAETRDAEAAGPERGIRGRVLDPAGDPLAGATVRVRAAGDDGGSAPEGERAVEPVVSGADGSFVLAEPPDGTVVVRVEAPGFAPFTATDVTAGTVLSVRLERGHRLAGRALAADSGRPVPGATVSACDRGADGFGDEACATATGAEDGTFVLAALATGTVDVEVVAPAFALARLDGVVVPGDGTPAEVFLRPGGDIAGRVVDPEGRTVEGASVTLVPVGNIELGRFRALPSREGLRTDANGAFRFEGVPAGGTYLVFAELEGFAGGSSRSVAVEAGDDVTGVSVELRRGAGLTGRLVDSDEAPVEVARIALIAPGEPAPERRRGGRFGRDTWIEGDRIETGDDGRFEVVDLRPGTYAVRLEPAGFEDVERDGIRLVEGETTDLGVLVAREGATLSGRVTDRSSEPVAGAEVSALWWEEGFKRRSAITRADGSYRLGGLGDEPVRELRASARGFVTRVLDDVAVGGTEVDFVLDRSGAIVGRVLLPDGEAPPAFEVQAHREADDDRGRTGIDFRRFRLSSSQAQTFVEPSGEFRLEDVETGTFTVEATARGLAAARKSGVRVDPGRVADAGTLVLRPGRTLRGRVVEATGGAPVIGAAVRATPPVGIGVRNPSRAGELNPTFSGTDGSFALGGLDAGVVEVHVDHPDFSPAALRVEIARDEDPAEVVVRLSRGGTVTGTVKDSRGAPVAATTVILTRRLGDRDAVLTTTDAEGRFTFERVTPATYQVLSLPQGGPMTLGATARSVTVEDGATVFVELDYTARIGLSGRVLRGGRDAVPGVLLVFVPEDGASAGMLGARSAQADAGGNYAVGLDQPGIYRVMVRSGGDRGGGSAVRIEVPDQDEAVIDVVLPTASISGSVVDDAGRPLAGAVVFAVREGAGAEGVGGRASAVSSADGTWALDGVEPGRYRLTASAEGFRLTENPPVDVAEGDALRVEFRLEPGAMIRGRVVDPYGGAVEGALVSVAPAGSAASTALRRVVTDVTGAFATASPSDGAVDVWVNARGWAPALRAGVSPDDGDGIVVRLGPGGSIAVVVVTADGAPVAGAQVYAEPLDGAPQTGWLGATPPPPTGADGSTTASLLAPGAYRVGVAGRDDVPPVETRVEEGGTSAVRLEIPGVASRSGTGP